MLGHVVARYFSEKNFEVLTTDKRFEAGHDCQMLREVSLSDADVVINCIGRIRQKTSNASDLFLANAILPIQILQQLKQNQKLVQISSDCVFSGQKNSAYDPTDAPDPIDAYGASKAAGEIVSLDKRAIVIRTSIIGPEINSSFGLFSWLSNNTSSKLYGYSNHLWNGVTTLQLARVIENMIDPKYDLSSKITHAISSKPVTKYELLCLINDFWALNKTIVPKDTLQSVNHVLAKNVSNLHFIEANGDSVEQQLKELREWYK